MSTHDEMSQSPTTAPRAERPADPGRKRRPLRAGVVMSALIIAGYGGLFVAFAATFCIENCPENTTPKSIGALILGLIGLASLVSSPFVAARISGRTHWFLAGVGSIGSLFLVVRVAAPLPVGFGNMESLFVAELGAAAMVAI